MVRAVSIALGKVSQRGRFRFHVLLLEQVSALFLSSRFLASLVSSGYLAFTILYTLLSVCLLFCAVTLLLFVFYRVFFVCLSQFLSPSCPVGIGLLVPLFLTCLLLSVLQAFICTPFLCRVIVFQGWICAYSVRRKLTRGRVCFVKL